MKIEIMPRPEITMIDGVACRKWIGLTVGKPRVACILYVSRVVTPPGEKAEQFDRELREVGPPRSLPLEQTLSDSDEIWRVFKYGARVAPDEMLGAALVSPEDEPEVKVVVQHLSDTGLVLHVCDKCYPALDRCVVCGRPYTGEQGGDDDADKP